MNKLRLRRGQTDERRYSFSDYLDWLTTWTVNGNTYTEPINQTYGGKQATEAIADNFEGYVRSAYKANGVVFACMLARLSVFSEARFLWRVRAQNSRPARTFTDQAIGLLDRPWVGGVTGDLLARMIQDADLAGNSYEVVVDDEIVRLRPDKAEWILEPRTFNGQQIGWRKLALYYRERKESEPAIFLPNEVCHFAPIPDPCATYRGMSWLTPVVREIQSDQAATLHKTRAFENNATPNMVVRLDPQITPDVFEAFVQKFKDEHTGPDNAGKPLFVGGAADVTVVGQDFKALDFKNVQGAGETRIAAAAGVPPVIVGLSEGLQAATYSNYSQARRRFADGTIRPLWRNAAASLETIVPPASSQIELWYDDTDIPFLREDEADRATITFTQAQAVRQLTDGGFEADAAVAAVMAGDLNALKGSHSGLFSVQLQEPGGTQPAENAPADAPANDNEATP